MRVHGICSYNGSSYSGWQKQIKESSIQQEIEKVLSKVLNSEINIQGSGRTDAGVHAINQHFHFDVNDEKKVDLDKLLHSMNSLLPRDIKIKSLETVDDSFHARFSATGKEYIYKITKVAKDPFKEGFAYFFPREFDISKLKEGLNLFVGKHNFQDFTSKEEDEANFVRNISSIEVNEENNDVLISFKGDGFMRYQIRFLVGVSLAYAAGDIDKNYIVEHLIENKPREITRYKVPGDGLYLFEVYY